MSATELKIDEEAERDIFEQSVSAATDVPVDYVKSIRKGDEYKNLLITCMWQGWRWRAGLAMLTEKNLTVTFTADMSAARTEVEKILSALEAENAELKSKLEQPTK